MRRSIADFRKEAAKELYELELSDGTVAVVRPSSDLSIEDGIASSRWITEQDGPSPLERQMRTMLGDNYEQFWDDMKSQPRYVLDAFVAEVDAHYVGEDEGDGGKAAS